MFCINLVPDGESLHRQYLNSFSSDVYVHDKYVQIRLHGGKYKLYGQTRGKPNKKPKNKTNKQGYPSPKNFKHL